jgi:hypothetical protein
MFGPGTARETGVGNFVGGFLAARAVPISPICGRSSKAKRVNVRKGLNRELVDIEVSLLF